jgi:Uma2 family endonuclease
MVLELGETHLSDTQLLALARANAPYRLERTATQQLIFMAPVGGLSGRTEFRLITPLDLWNDATGLGYGFSSAAGFFLANGAMRSPDVAWVLKDRYEALATEVQIGFLPLAPDFIAEIRSASDRLADLQVKMEEWIQNGVRLGWLIDPSTQTSWVYRPGQPALVVQGFDQTLSGEDVLPGFIFHLNRLR